MPVPDHEPCIAANGASTGAASTGKKATGSQTKIAMSQIAYKWKRLDSDQQIIMLGSKCETEIDDSLIEEVIP